MKNCPKCNRTYSDDALSFCLDDGSLLNNISEAQTELFEKPTVVRPLDEIPTVVQLTAKETKTSIGLKSNVAAFICYLPICNFGTLLPLFFLLSERKNSFVRFHAIQSFFAQFLIIPLYQTNVYLGGLYFSEKSPLLQSVTNVGQTHHF
jgi:hypothetical protein